MKKYRKKSGTAEAVQWHKLGDHPGVQEFSTRKGMAVGQNCLACKQPMARHGWFVHDRGGFAICPGLWIILDVHGNISTLKPDAFDAIYEEVEA